jgi:peptide/nickel transport system permease protein
MLLFLLRRLAQSVLVLGVLSLLVFIGVYAIGNPLDLLIDPQASATDIAHTAALLGLDQPWWVQYQRFVLATLHGDLGTSFQHGEPALQLILQRFPATFELALVAMLLAVTLGIPLGLLAGLYADRWLGKSIMTGSILGFSLPTFWVGLLLILGFSIELGWLPASGRGETRPWLGIEWSILTLDGWTHLLLPACNLALFKISLLIRLTSAGTRDALQQDHVRFARAKGLSEWRVIQRHVLKNILIPIVTVLGMEFASLLAYAVVTESIFAWPGMGKLLLDAIVSLNRPVVVAYLLLVALLYVVINLLVDLCYLVLDPRVRISGVSG